MGDIKVLGRINLDLLEKTGKTIFIPKVKVEEIPYDYDGIEEDWVDYKRMENCSMK